VYACVSLSVVDTLRYTRTVRCKSEGNDEAAA
jgi:hypothetical protein